MPRKETITKQELLNCAFEMTMEEGIEQLTARKLAGKAGCSTQPIFRVYKNMEELSDEVFEMAIDYFDEFYQNYIKEEITPFVNLGMAYISFAQEHKNLFRLLFINENRRGKSFYEILNGKHQAVMNEVNEASKLGVKDPQNMFMRMWIFIHGAASMTLTNDYDLGIRETAQLLAEAFHSFDR